MMLLISGGLYLMRDKIIGVVVSAVNKNLTTPVQVEELTLTFWSSFPNLSVDFNHVYIADATTQTTVADTLFYSDRIRLKLNPFDVLKKNYEVREIEIFPGKGYLKRLADGTVNYDIVKKDPNQKKSSDFKFSLKNVEFHDFLLGYNDEKVKQDYLIEFQNAELVGDFSNVSTVLQLKTENQIRYLKSDGIALVKNTPSKFEVQLVIDQINGTLTIPRTPVSIGELPFQFALSSTPSNLNFDLSSNGLKLTDLVKRLNHRSTQSIKDIEGTGDLIFGLQYAQTGNKKPKIDAIFQLKNGQIVEPSKNLPIRNIQLAGKFTNHANKNSELLEISQLSFHTSAGPFSGQLKISDFAHPNIKGNANGTLDLAVIHSLFEIPTIQSTKGKVTLAGNFDLQQNQGEIKINHCEANIGFQEVQFQQIDDKRYYDHLNGSLFMDGNTAKIDDLRLTVGKSDVAMRGDVINIEPYLNKRENLNVEMQLSSVFLDVQDFSSSSKKEEIANGRNFILPADIQGNVRLISNQLVYEKHTFKQLKTNLKIGNRRIDFNELELKNSEAHIRGTASITEFSPEIFTIETLASTDRLSFQPLFKEWDNFDQQIITADQISGFAQVKLHFKAPFDLRSGIQKKNIVAAVDLKVEEGRMKNVLAFKEITKSLKDSKTTRLILKQNNINNFEKELLDLRFENFQNTLTIQNGTITIPEMLIASNALDVRLNGTHDFDNQVDYRFSFNFRDIRKQARMTEFGEVVDDGTGMQLFVHMFGPMDSPTIQWDQEATKLLVKETFEAEKQNAKAILKSELGLFKKDTTIAAYVPKAKLKEEIIVVSSNQKEEPEFESVKKETKLNKTFNKWKQEAESDKKGKVTTEGF
ncbi:MAG: AsmA-like C-terminal region-containing protein [Bacteroidetes bacterium]|nr:AsmA-like C-terminal region-containing protein [Bacteroidota bacterium]